MNRPSNTLRTSSKSHGEANLSNLELAKFRLAKKDFYIKRIPMVQGLEHRNEASKITRRSQTKKQVERLVGKTPAHPPKTGDSQILNMKAAPPL